MATQEERRAETRSKLIRAATDTLVDLGAGAFTTTEVARRSGLSQGAIFKHFATKPDLLAATVESIFATLVERYAGEFAARVPETEVDAAERLAAGLDLLWEIFQDPELLAAYDLFAAARTDADLQAFLQPVVRAHIVRLHDLADLLFADLALDDPERLHGAVDLVAATMQGLVINRLAVAEPGVEERVRDLLHRWVGERLAARQEV